jgi:hypothetical protein
MRQRTAAICVGLAAGVLALAGCSDPPVLFLNLPEGQERKYEESNPDAEPQLRGIVTVSKVQPSDYGTYQRLRSANRVVADFRQEQWVYFATDELKQVKLPPARLGQPPRTVTLTVTNRFKAEIPPRK